MKKHLCLGGPLDKQHIDWETARINGYVQYNNAIRRVRTLIARRRAEREGKVITPSMVYLHESLFTYPESQARVVFHA